MFDQLTVPRLMVAGATSSSGKTTVALGLVAALTRRGQTVQTFKVGPGLIDSAYLAHVSHRPCRNLDPWLLGGNGVLRSLASGASAADSVVIEGAHGIFDCHGLRPEEGPAGAYPFPGSTAEVARLVSAPVVLVVDVSAMGETAAAIALGIRHLDPKLRIIGVVLNNVPSEYHRRLIEDAVWSLATLPVLGALPTIEAIGIPEWHMGLLPITENPHIDPAIDHLAAAMERHCDLALVERLMAGAEPVSAPPRPPVSAPPSDAVRIGVAFDDAFCFYYPENLEMLEEAGAEIVPFSPLEERTLPPNLDGLYLGGGFSEVFAPRLAANRSLLDQLARAKSQGLPIFAESGGLLLLAQSLRTSDGTVHRMAGVLPVDAVMDSTIPRAGYRELRVMADSLIGAAGTRLRGHEFHLSSIASVANGPSPAYSMHDCGGEPLGCEGWAFGDVVVSFVHLHFGQDPGIAERLVVRMRAARQARRGSIATAAG